MGFSFRKSIKIAKGVRLNLSKSGAGISYGIKGFRISHNAKGSYINAGGGGFYYRKKLDSKTGKGYNKKTNCDFDNGDIYDYISYPHLLKNVSGDYEYYIHNKTEWLLNDVISYFEIKTKWSCLSLLTFVIGFFCPLFWLVNIAYYIFLIKKQKSILIEISKKSLIKDTANILSDISNNYIIHNSVSNNELKYGQANLKGLIDSYVPYIALEEYKLYFIDAGILMWDKNTVFIVPYTELELSMEETASLMIDPPEYAVILDHTYEHVNKNGTPNKRYKINRKIDKIKTWAIIIKSENYISIPLAIFDEQKAKIIFNIFNELKNQNVSPLDKTQKQGIIKI